MVTYGSLKVNWCHLTKWTSSPWWVSLDSYNSKFYLQRSLLLYPYKWRNGLKVNQFFSYNRPLNYGTMKRTVRIIVPGLNKSSDSITATPLLLPRILYIFCKHKHDKNNKAEIGKKNNKKKIKQIIRTFRGWEVQTQKTAITMVYISFMNLTITSHIHIERSS